MNNFLPVAGSFDFRKARRIFLVTIAWASCQVHLQQQSYYMKLCYSFCLIFKFVFFSAFFSCLRHHMTLCCFRTMKITLWKQFSTFQSSIAEIYNSPKQDIDNYMESNREDQKLCYNQGSLKYPRRQSKGERQFSVGKEAVE